MSSILLLIVLGVVILGMIIGYRHAKQDKRPAFYTSEPHWQKLQAHLPEAYQFDLISSPREDYWSWHDNLIHVERYKNPNAKAKIILLHGVGTNSRQMTLILGRPLAFAGYETVSLDLLGYGLTRVKQQQPVLYDDWVQLVCDFIDAEAQADDRPIILYGLSAGGMLAYHVAAKSTYVKGIIGMTFLDQRYDAVKKGTMRFSLFSPITLLAMRIAVKTPFRHLKLPMKLVAKMHYLANNSLALKIMLKDKTSAGNAMTVAFLNSYMTYEPAIEPEAFTQCPILLTQPENDHWTPLEFSAPFLQRLEQTSHEVVVLPHGGHYPIEPEALAELSRQTMNFIEKVVVNSSTKLKL